jgi:hypothetical protein
VQAKPACINGLPQQEFDKALESLEKLAHDNELQPNSFEGCSMLPLSGKAGGNNMTERKVIPFEKPQKHAKQELPSRMSIDKYLRMAREVLESHSLNAIALQKTIETHHEAIKLRKQIRELELLDPGLEK